MLEFATREEMAKRSKCGLEPDEPAHPRDRTDQWPLIARDNEHGEVDEWFKSHAWKACVR